PGLIANRSALQFGPGCSHSLRALFADRMGEGALGVDGSDSRARGSNPGAVELEAVAPGAHNHDLAVVERRSDTREDLARVHERPLLSPAVGSCWGGRSRRWLSTTAAATSLSLRPLFWEWSRSRSNAPSALIEWRAIR